eukprot:TRINITY_DN66235_c6_g5_i2.p1 TRINITY_DN66235_c6_g5~~TRINITY_DN66235_c6_g5_i2.p1  ORF type:complete len:300 (+),score=132.95 TRINITY_DN66235_c6_g5_i2:217-1116(+)
MYAKSASVEVCQLLVLHSFRVLLKVGTVHEQEETCLRWITQLYLSPRPDDSQPLPFDTPSRKVKHVKDREQRTLMLWGHLRAITDALSNLYSFYSAGHVHLMSRQESASVIKRQGDYLFRLSNRQPSTMIITNCRTHIYLSPDGLRKHNVEFPFDAVPIVSRNFAGVQFEIVQWSLPTLKAFLRQHKHSMFLDKPLLGAVSIDMIDSTYNDLVDTQYHSLRSSEVMYVSDVLMDDKPLSSTSATAAAAARSSSSSSSSTTTTSSSLSALSKKANMPMPPMYLAHDHDEDDDDGEEDGPD